VKAGGLRIHVTFDTRNLVLDMEIQDAWDEDIKAMWNANKVAVRERLLAELGSADAERKLDNYRAMGPEPWSVVFEYSALLHQLVLTLREDYVNHPATTKRVRSGHLGDEWGSLVGVLHGWGVLDDEVTGTYRELEKGAGVCAARWPSALLPDTPGVSFLALAAQEEPLIKRIFLPHCALASPAHRLEFSESIPEEWIVYDDTEYPCHPLSDEQFAQRVAGVAKDRAEPAE
jgi:hypothetical protein